MTQILKMLRFPIYIPSRGRAENCLTARIFEEYNIPYTLVVEPQEVRKYEEVFPKEKILVLSDNNRGVWFARNWIKQLSSGVRGEIYHWQIDDNILSFRWRLEEKNEKVDPAEVFVTVEDFVTGYKNIAIAGLHHHLYAWAARKDISVNVQCPSCVLLNNSVPLYWRSDCCEDTDYSMQVLTAGWCTVRFNRLIFEKPPHCSVPGGCTEIEYGEDRKRKRSEGLIRNWPGCFELGEKRGKTTIKPSWIWSSFKQRLIPIGEDRWTVPLIGVANES